MNKQDLERYLLDEAVLEAWIYETDKKNILRHILARLLYGHRGSHDYLETLLNRLLETERKCSFVLEGKTAIPHLTLDVEDAPEPRAGWFTLRNHVMFGANGESPVRLIFCALANDEHLPIIMAGACQMLRDSKFREEVINANDAWGTWEQIWKKIGCPNPAPTPGGFANPTMCIESAKITFRRGIHARGAYAIVKVVEMFDSDVSITAGGVTVNGASIMGLMALAAGPGTDILIETQGPDAEVALKEVTRLINHSMCY